MEERLKQVLEFTNYKHTLNNQLHKLRIKADGMLMHHEAGGKFTINRELICFLDLIIRRGYTEVTLLDDNKSPVLISNTDEFLDKIITRYFEVTNDYFKEAHIIKKARSVKSILDIKDV